MLSIVQVLDNDAAERGINDPRCFARGRAAALELIREYMAWLGEDLCAQGVEEELARLPGKYAPPLGALLVGWAGDVPVATGAIRPLGEGTAEVKRLYVRPAYRGMGHGETMLAALVTAAGNLGHRRVVLDTLERLGPANRLYDRLGFRRTDPYWDNPIAGVVYYEKILR